MDKLKYLYNYQRKINFTRNIHKFLYVLYTFLHAYISINERVSFLSITTYTEQCSLNMSKQVVRNIYSQSAQ